MLKILNPNFFIEQFKEFYMGVKLRPSGRIWLVKQQPRADFGEKGTIELLSFIHERPRRYTELEEEIKISHTSLLRRLKILQTLNIIKKQPIRSKKRSTHAYALTITGERLMKFIEAYENEMNLWYCPNLYS